MVSNPLGYPENNASAGFWLTGMDGGDCVSMRHQSVILRAQKQLEFSAYDG